MANTSRKGAEAERLVRADHEAKGYLAAERRHVKGGGDHVFIHPNGQIKLVETKAIPKKAGRFHAFGPADREIMRDTPLPRGGERWLANVRGREIEYVPELGWPPKPPID